MAPEDLVEILSQPHPPLAGAAAAVANFVDPTPGAPDCAAVLDELAGEAVPTAEGVIELLYGRHGFVGDEHDYHAPANSLLPDVLRRRRGMPLTLAIVVIEVADRVGVPLVPIGMPGHFLVELPAGSYLDPFTGATLDRRGVEARFRSVHGTAAVLQDQHLQSVGTGEVIARLLRNLERSCAHRGPRLRHLAVVELQCALPGAGPLERARRAEALAASGRPIESAAAWEALAAGLDGPQALACRRAASLVRAGLS